MQESVKQKFCNDVSVKAKNLNDRKTLDKVNGVSGTQIIIYYHKNCKTKYVEQIDPLKKGTVTQSSTQESRDLHSAATELVFKQVHETVMLK